MTDETDTEEGDDEPETEEYRLRDDVEKINSAGVLLEGDDTLELTPDEAGEINGRHGDVLEPVDGGGDA